MNAVARLVAALALLGALGACSTDSRQCGECLRAINCRVSCHEPIIQSSCCACPAGTIDDIQCPHDGGM